MTGQRLLDAAVMAVSLFNTILLAWLGLTVLLNARGRTWPVRLGGGGLVMGAAFMAIHTAIYVQGWEQITWGLNLLWGAGWVLVVCLPLSWYLLTLWYAGYWDVADAPLHRRQRPCLVAVLCLALGLVLLLLLASPFPSYYDIVDYERAVAPLGGVPLYGLLYPLYIVLCILLSLDALGHPVPSGHMMGDLARRRARPWLLATSVMLLVSGLVAVVIGWVLLSTPRSFDAGSLQRLADTVAWFDLAIDSLLSAGILFLGQAVVSYEIFTGKALPRRGLRRHWRVVMALAAGYAFFVAANLSTHVRPIYGLMVATVLVAAAFALLSWRSYDDRERTIAGLRPFVAGQGLYEQILSPSPWPGVPADLRAPFDALAGSLLGARVAFLLPLGPLAPLVGTPLAYPQGQAPPLATGALAARCATPQTLCLDLDPEAYGGAAWAVPLWSARGLAGLLLLGEKRDGGLYTQEEIEIAQATGERMLDTLAGAEIARRLMALQRQRLASGQALDGSARRLIHDELLPRLHTCLLELSARGAGDAVDQLAEVHRRLSDFLRSLPGGSSSALVQEGLIAALQQVVEGELAQSFATVAWHVEPPAEESLRALKPAIAEVLYGAAREVVRNAAHHARGGDPSRPIHLRITVRWDRGLQLIVEDDGVGLGKTAGDSPGAGQGLA
ncbi:MAG: hypothetical protein ACUVX9_00510, partial [Anaerolineae bacterium]